MDAKTVNYYIKTCRSVTAEVNEHLENLPKRRRVQVQLDEILVTLSRVLGQVKEWMPTYAWKSKQVKEFQNWKDYEKQNDLNYVHAYKAYVLYTPEYNLTEALFLILDLLGFLEFESDDLGFIKKDPTFTKDENIYIKLRRGIEFIARNCFYYSTTKEYPIIADGILSNLEAAAAFVIHISHLVNFDLEEYLNDYIRFLKEERKELDSL